MPFIILLALVLFSAGANAQNAVPNPTIRPRCSDTQPQPCVTAPRPVYSPDPEYTAETRDSGIEGTVNVSVLVGTDGTVSNAHVTKSLDKALDEQALKAVAQWKFEPATYDGKPTATRVSVEVSFRLPAGLSAQDAVKPLANERPLCSNTQPQPCLVNARAIYTPNAPYTDQAKNAHVEGTIQVWIAIGANGSVQDVQVQKPLGNGLDEEAIKTVKQWKFEPATYNGKPVSVRATAKLRFHLPQ